MDHTPGQGQFKDLEIYRKSVDYSTGQTFEDIMNYHKDKQKLTFEQMQELARIAHSKNLTVASHIDNEYGSLEKGKKADVLIVDEIDGYPVITHMLVDGKTVVDAVSFDIPKGKVISLIGPNGAGKSTVMGMISRLIAKDEGLVDFEGKDMGKWKSKELAKRLAILTQHNNIQMKLTVRELVAFGRFPYSGNRLTVKDRDIINQAIAYNDVYICSLWKYQQ